VSDGALIGGGLGAAGSAAIGAATTNSVAAPWWAACWAQCDGIAGTAIDRIRAGAASGDGAEDNGQQVTVAQYDDGDVQMGDRVQIVYDSNGVAKVVRDTGYRRD
jgi:outer membrane lipoprotein SlyB